MTNISKTSPSSRRRFLSVAGGSTLLLLVIGAQAKRASRHRTEGINREDVRAFTRDFALLIDEGRLSLVAILDILARQQRNAELRAVIVQINREIAEGATLSREMAKFPTVFDATYIAQIQTGEYRGTLEISLRELAQSW